MPIYNTQICNFKNICLDFKLFVYMPFRKRHVIEPYLLSNGIKPSMLSSFVDTCRTWNLKMKIESIHRIMEMRVENKYRKGMRQKGKMWIMVRQYVEILLEKNKHKCQKQCTSYI